jgi:hypothetical protein
VCLFLCRCSGSQNDHFDVQRTGFKGRHVPTVYLMDLLASISNFCRPFLNSVCCSSQAQPRREQRIRLPRISPSSSAWRRRPHFAILGSREFRTTSTSPPREVNYTYRITVPETTKIDPILRKGLIRGFYFAEAMAVYERYYQPLVATYRPAQKELADPGRHEDRPPTWVPLVFHCTLEDDLKQIFEDGRLRPNKNRTLSFTEIPIGELDRMKYRHHDKQQVAIGFPRRYIESLGLTPVWYLKHNPEISKALGKWEASDPDAFAQLKPFIDEDEDVAPFQEIRTTASVNMEEAVWLLTTNRTTENELVIPGVDTFQTKYGKISQSFWHRSHQMGILSEWQFAKITRDEKDVPIGFQFRGEYYWRRLTTETKELSVTLPAHQREIMFEVTKLAQQEAFDGPLRFLDVARSFARVLAEAGDDLDVALCYRLIRDISTL